jgi:DivIVA domain-containing protein
MEMSPKAISSMTFPLARKGYDQEQVRTFLAKVARGIEDLQSRTLQAEAKARLGDTPGDVAAPMATAPAAAPEGGVDSITRTLLIAQRTADAAVAEARDEADGMRREAEERAETVLAEARARANNLVTAAEAEALRVGEITTGKVQAEVTALEGRRQQLLDDIDRLSSHVTEQRERIAATVDVLQRALDHPDGLRELPQPDLLAPAASLPPPAGATPAGEAVPVTNGGPADLTGEIPRPDEVASYPPSWTDAPASGGSDAGASGPTAPPEGQGEAESAAEPAAEPAAVAQATEAEPAPDEAQQPAASEPAPPTPDEEAAEQEGDTGAWRRFFEGGPSADDRWKQ